MVTVSKRWILAAGALAMPGCKPEFADLDALVSQPRVLAIQATPAEAAPPAAIRFDALYVSPGGDADADNLSWAYCIARKPLTDEGTLAPECLKLTGEGLLQLGSGQGRKGALPTDACQFFGPQVPPPAVPGLPPGRPVDPDASGGYYQPIRLLTPATSSSAVVGTERLVCGLASATPDQSIEFNQRYRLNENPIVQGLGLWRGGRWTLLKPNDDGAPTVAVHPGEELDLEVSWPECSRGVDCGDGICDIDEDLEHCPKDCTTPRGCGGAERYLLFTPESHDLVERREKIEIAWFSNGGKFTVDRTDREADDFATNSQNKLVAPSGAGELRLWIVLRDDRGGAGWASYRLTVSD